jgi:hypothetical protein
MIGQSERFVSIHRYTLEQTMRHHCLEEVEIQFIGRLGTENGTGCAGKAGEVQ